MWVTHSPNLWTRNAWRTCWQWWVTNSEMGAHRWRQSQHGNRYCFQQYGIFSSKIFWIKRSCAVVLWNANDESKRWQASDNSSRWANLNFDRIVSEIAFQLVYPDNGTQLHEMCDCSAKGAEFEFCKLYDGRWILELTGRVWSGSLSCNHSDYLTLVVGGVIRFPCPEEHFTCPYFLFSVLCTSCLSVRVAQRAYSLSFGRAQLTVHAQFTHAWFTAAFRLWFVFIPRLSGKR